MSGSAYVNLALKILGCSQKELAARLNVSPTQISKWKHDEHMSYEMQNKLLELTGVGSMLPDFVLATGSLAEAKKWEALIKWLANEALESAETGYNTELLQYEIELLCSNTFSVLKEMGIAIPPTFPSELETIIAQAEMDDSEREEDDEEYYDVIHTNQYSQAIYQIFCSLNDIYGFYAAYVADLIIDNDDLDDIDIDIYYYLIDLAATKIDVDPGFAPNYQKFCYQTKTIVKEQIKAIKEKAFRSSIPLRAELMDLVTASANNLGHQAERVSLGFIDNQIHPDIYMNELLVGMRIIHQVLPKIMEKLGIADDFEIDESQLQCGHVDD